MGVDPSLMLCAFAIGVAQMADAYLLRSGKGRGRTAVAFSIVEWVWGAWCLYLLINPSGRFPSWLAGVFVVQLVAWTVYTVAQVKRGRTAATFELSPAEASVGGVFGAGYAAASFAAWMGILI